MTPDDRSPRDLMRMTPKEYRSLRESLGSRRVVAEALGLGVMALYWRERGRAPVRREAALAMFFLACHGLDAEPWRRPGRGDVYGTPAELREALLTLGLSATEAAREILGAGRSQQQRMSRMLAGSRPIPEHVARLVKRRLGLDLQDPWPVRESRAWDNTESVVAGLEGGA